MYALPPLVTPPNLSSKRIFILGPSHHLYLDSCALSACEFYSTPLGKLTLDTEVLSALHANPTEKFPYMSLEADEEEHSIEMHLPYVYKLLSMANKTSSVKIVPIMVGAISTRKEKVYGAVLAPYLQDPTNLFIVSSDFCHW